ncbi:metalloregulator ArsR/SmtB family transcription factor [Microbacterium sp. LWH11-1.2]|jgi:DNA-binding transcriptional ArsR family regulator|uniref:ArsR/SmtB family transcription factor n=1 Tax=unclassified Microbacterium TaxID=2609290 RepID=UPI00313978A2
MTDVFALVAEPSRRRILDELSATDGLLVGDIVEATGLSQSNVSKHLGVLRQGNLVYGIPEGKARRYRIEPSALAPIEEWLAPYRRKWTDAIESLARHLDETPERTDHGH